MWRASMPYGRKGIAVHALSAVDLALYDLLGKLREEPVFALLGGKTKERVPVYATTARPDLAQQLGFVGAKYPLAYGAVDGDQGMKKNVEIHKEWRAAVGPDYPLMVDCYMSLTVPTSVQLAQQLAPHGVKWIEEYLQPDDYEGLRQVKAAVGGTDCLLATAEHEYSRWGYKQLIDDGCVDVLQPDITWLGGITEARRVIAMASASGVMVIPHGSSVFSYHLALASVNVPMSEYITPQLDHITPYYTGLFEGEPLPKDGALELDETKPGFGLTLVRDGLHRPYARDRDWSRLNAAANLHFKEVEPPRMRL